MTTTVRAGLILGSLSLVVLAAILWRTQPQPVQTARVDRGLVEHWLQGDGEVHLTRRFVFVAPAGGSYQRPPWRSGDRVRKGDLLLQLQARAKPVGAENRERRLTEATTALDAAQAAATAASKRLEFVQKEHERLQQLDVAAGHSRGELEKSSFRLDEAEAQLREAAFRVDIARHAIDLARWQAALSSAGTDNVTLAVHAPVGGVILALPGESSGEVEAGEMLIEIGDPDSRVAEVEFPSQVDPAIEEGTRVRLAAGEQMLEGHVRQSVNVATSENGTRVHAHIAPDAPRAAWTSLDDGHPVTARVLAWGGEASRRLPNAALFREEDRWMAYRVEGGKAYAVPVTPGRSGDRYTEVVSGLAEGDAVILAPSANLRDGERVAEY